MTLGLKAKTLNHETAVFMCGICMILGSTVVVKFAITRFGATRE
jgi:hypothetical protein